MNHNFEQCCDIYQEGNKGWLIAIIAYYISEVFKTFNTGDLDGMYNVYLKQGSTMMLARPSKSGKSTFAWKMVKYRYAMLMLKCMLCISQTKSEVY